MIRASYPMWKLKEFIDRFGENEVSLCCSTEEWDCFQKAIKPFERAIEQEEKQVIESYLIECWKEITEIVKCQSSANAREIMWKIYNKGKEGK